MSRPLGLVVVGGGIAGLTAAHHARTRFGDRGVDVTVLEADDHPGSPSPAAVRGADASSQGAAT